MPKEREEREKEQIIQQILQLHQEHPEWSPKQISDEIGQYQSYVSRVIKKWEREQKQIAKRREQEEACKKYVEQAIALLKERYFIEGETVVFTTPCKEHRFLRFQKSAWIKNKIISKYSKKVTGLLCFTNEQIYCVNERDEILVFSYESPHYINRNRRFLLIDKENDPNKLSGKTWFRELSSEAINKIDEIYVQKGKEIRIRAKTIQVAVQKYCYECGAENPPHAKFCGRCGKSITILPH